MLPYLLAGIASRGNVSNEGDLISLTGHTVWSGDQDGSPYNAEASVTVQNDGKLRLFQIGDNSDPNDTSPIAQWVIGYPNASYAADFEARATEFSWNGNGTRTGTMDTWIDCSTGNSNRVWKIDMVGPADAWWTVQLEIRHKTSLVVYGDALISLNTVNAFD